MTAAPRVAPLGRARPQGRALASPVGPAARRIELALRLLVVAVATAVLPAVFIGDVRHYWEVAGRLGFGHLPYRSFLWEFPPLTTPILLLRFLTGGSYGGFLVAFALVMVAAEYASLEVLRRSRPAQAPAIGRYWHVVGLPLLTIAAFRLDELAVLAATVAFVGLTAGHRVARAVVAGFALKLWPAVLIAVLAAQRRYREAAVATAGVLAVVAAWLVWSPSGLRAFLAFRRGSGLQVESLAGGWRLLVGHQRPEFVSGAWVVDRGRFGWVEPLSMAVVVVVVAAIVVAARSRPIDITCLCGGVVGAVLLSSRLLSPQYLVWLLPFAAAAWAEGRRRAGIVFGLASLLSVIVMVDYRGVLTADRFPAVLIFLRNGLLVAFTVDLLWGALGRRQAEVS